MAALRTAFGGRKACLQTALQAMFERSHHALRVIIMSMIG
jgi:hypothetical protein